MRRTACLALALLTLLPAACGDDDDTGDAAEETTTTTAAPDATGTTAPGVVCDPVALDAAALADARPDGVPAGYELQPEAVGDTGPSDLAKAAEDDGEDGAEAALSGARFRRGYQWLWISDDDSQLIGFVYEFCDEAGAGAYRDRGLSRTGLTEFPVETDGSEALQGAEGRSGATGPVGTARVLVVRGPYLVVASANAELAQHSLEDLQSQATDLAEAIVGKLPAPTG
jgi:hypothetical protein